MSEPGKILILDIPVLHQGYVNLLKRLRTEVQGLHIVGPEFLLEFGLNKEIRRLDPETVKEFIRSLCWFGYVAILDKDSISYLKSHSLITTSDFFSRQLMNKYFSGYSIFYESVFLRWDEDYIYVAKDVVYDRLSDDSKDISVMKELLEQAKKLSPDWWRQVGARLIGIHGWTFSAYNTHVPEEYTNYALGDIRDFMKAGEKSEISSALHAEQAVITQAAKKGISLEGASIYVTAFPCPICAKLIAYSGIKQCYYYSGSASFDGQMVLRAKGVEIIKVEDQRRVKNDQTD